MKPLPKNLNPPLCRKQFLCNNGVTFAANEKSSNESFLKEPELFTAVI